MNKQTKKVLWLIAMLVFTSSAFAQKIAILNFNYGEGLKQADVDGLSSVFATYFNPKTYQVIEKSSVNQLLQEENSQQNKFNDTQIANLGKKLNAQLILVGDLSIVMGENNLEIKVINTENAETLIKDGISWNKGVSFRTTIQGFAEKLSAKIDNITIKETSKDTKTDVANVNKNIKPKFRTEVVIINDNLKLYPEEFTQSKLNPDLILYGLNKDEKYNYDTWRLPTEEELEIIKGKGYLSECKYMTNKDRNGMILFVSTGEMVKLPIKKHELSLHTGYGGVVNGDRAFGDYGVVNPLSFHIKYKYKLFKNYDIRLFGEAGYNSLGTPFTHIPLMLGFNYEYRFNKKSSIYIDLGAGIHFSLNKKVSEGGPKSIILPEDYDNEQAWEDNLPIEIDGDIERFRKYGTTSDLLLERDLSFTGIGEIGFKFYKFSFSVKYMLSHLPAYKNTYRIVYHDWAHNINCREIENSQYCFERETRYLGRDFSHFISLNLGFHF